MHVFTKNLRVCGDKDVYLHRNYKQRQFYFFKYEV